jgi:hypothetical protein
VARQTPPQKCLSDAVPLLLEKLQVEGTRLAAVKAIGVMASAPTPVFEGTLSPFWDTLLTLLRKSDRTLQLETLHASAALLQRYGLTGPGDSQRLDALLVQATDLITDSDLMLAAATLSVAVIAIRVRSLHGLNPAIA